MPGVLSPNDPQTASASATLGSHASDQTMSLAPPPPSAGLHHAPEDLPFGGMGGNAAAQGFGTPPTTTTRPAYNAMIHSTPTSPQARLMAGSYFDAMRQDPATVVMSRQPPNPRIFNDGPVSHLPSSAAAIDAATASSFSPSTSGSVAPAATVQPASTLGGGGGAGGHHGHTQSWAFSSSSDPTLSGFASPMQPQNPAAAQIAESSSHSAAAPRRAATRPRANTVGALSTLSRPGSPSDMDESYMPAGAGSEQISPELREEMNAVFVDWLQELCNDCESDHHHVHGFHAEALG